jgi:protein ImuB
VERVQNALRLAAVSPEAARAGLLPGLTLADARARVPALRVAEADPAADAALLGRIAVFCDRFTPLVALAPPDGLTLDVTGCTHLSGGAAPLRAEVLRRLGRLGLRARATVAPTPEAAQALARHGEVGVAEPAALAAAVRALPVVALEAPPETLAGLRRAGLRTLGEVADRPAAALAARFGAGLVTRLRRLLGAEDARITPLRPPPDCVAEQAFAEPLTRAEAVEGVLAALAPHVCAMLERRGAGGRRFEAVLFRSDGAVRRIGIETGAPCRDPAAILRLFRTRIGALAEPIDPGWGFDLIRLAAPVAEPMPPEQPGFDGRAAAAAELAGLADRLAARFGRDRVLRPAARDSHDPVRSVVFRPAGAPPAPAAWPGPGPGEPPVRPLRLFEPPEPLEALAEVPDGPPLRFRWRRVLHRVARAEGPERIAPDWWREGPGGAVRDYYRVEDAEGRRFWLFRRGLYGEAGAAGAPRWFLHGLFA